MTPHHIQAVSAFMDRFGTGADVAFWVLLLLLPGLIGVIVGAQLLGRELELGTRRRAWSQSVPQTRWLVTRLALVTGGLAVLGAAMAAVTIWYREPMDRLTRHLIGNAYGVDSVVLTAYILCAFWLAVLAGWSWGAASRR